MNLVLTLILVVEVEATIAMTFWAWWFCWFHPASRLPLQRIPCDGGKSISHYPAETNDCTVKALAIASQTSYDKAYEILASLGRPVNEGFHVCSAIRRHLNCKRARRTGTLGWFAKSHKGRWIVSRSGHAIAIIDGVIYDEVVSKSDDILYAAIRLD